MMRSVVRRAVVAAGAVALVLGTGAGVAAAAPQVPVLAWTPPGPVFGTLVPGDTASQAFTLTNTGGGGSSQLTITATPSSAYTIKPGTDTCTGKSLGPGKSCTVTVIFTAPATPGSYPGTLTATGSKPNVTATVNLAGQSAKATPSVSTSPQPAAGLLRTIVSDQATVTGGDNPGGTVTFVLYRAPDCSPNSQLLTSANVPLVNGTATSAGTQLTTAGTYYWQATYNGDGKNNPVTTGCTDEPVVIGSCVVTNTASGQAFPDLQDAVNAASSGDTLIIEGTCTGDTTLNKSLTLTGQATASTPTATLDGGQQGSVLTINNGGTTTLNSLIITDGFTQVGTNNGGGIWFDGGGTLTVNNSTITNNAAIEDAGSGGAIASTSGAVTVNSSTITDNRAGLGGGIELSGGTMTLNDTTIGDNPTTSGGGNTAFDGGGVYIGGGTLNINGGNIMDNTANGDGGGGIYYDRGTVNLSASTNLSGNQPDNCFPAGSLPGC